MKNIFKLGSVFMAIALLVSTILVTGVLVSADQVVASWATDGGVNYTYLYNGTEYINVYGGKTDASGTSWKTFANTVKPSIAADEYMVYEISGSFEGAEAANVSLNNTGYDNVNGDAVVESCSATAIKIRMDGPFATVTGDDPGLNLTITSVTAAAASVQTETNVTVTVYQKGGSSETTATGAETGAEPTATAAETGAEPTATEPQPTEPVAAVDWQLIYDGSFSGDVDFEASGCLAPIPGDDWNNAMAAEIATYGVSEKYKIVSDAAFSGDGYACWGIYEPVSEKQWWGDAFDDATYPYIIDIATVEEGTGAIDDSFIFGMVGEGACSVSADTFQVYAYREAGTEPTATATETEPTATATATEAEPTATATEAEPTATATEAEPTATEAEPTATATEAEPTATEAEPTATEAEPTATEAEPTATQAEPVSLVETVLVENNVGGTKTLKPEKTDAWFLVVNEIKSDIAKNGPIDPDKGEYYQIIVTGSVDNGEADFHLGEGLDWNEYWGESGSITTESSTVVATIPVAIPAEGIGDVYLADSGEAGHTLTWTYAKVSVFRVGEPTEPVVTETEPAATGTGTDIDDVLLGDANGDGDINLKDVLAARKYVAGMEVEIDLVASDVNFDDAVNMKDILLIRKYIAEMITSFIE